LKSIQNIYQFLASSHVAQAEENAESHLMKFMSKLSILSNGQLNWEQWN